MNSFILSFLLLPRFSCLLPTTGYSSFGFDCFQSSLSLLRPFLFIQLGQHQSHAFHHHSSTRVRLATVFHILPHPCPPGRRLQTAQSTRSALLLTPSVNPYRLVLSTAAGCFAITAKARASSAIESFTATSAHSAVILAHWLPLLP